MSDFKDEIKRMQDSLDPIRKQAEIYNNLTKSLSISSLYSLEALSGVNKITTLANSIEHMTKPLTKVANIVGTAFNPSISALKVFNNMTIASTQNMLTDNLLGTTTKISSIIKPLNIQPIKLFDEAVWENLTVKLQAPIFTQINVTKAFSSPKITEILNSQIFSAKVALDAANSVVSTLEFMNDNLYDQEFDELINKFQELDENEEIVDFMNNISMADMENVISGKEIEDTENLVSYGEFKREMLLIDFSNDFTNILPYFESAYHISDRLIDPSFKQELYSKMMDGVASLISKGLVIIAVAIFVIIINYKLRDYKIYRDFIKLLHEGKKMIDD